MILRRLGNKKKIAKKLLTEFPKHDLYIEPFFGAGGMFFNKPKAKYNIVNDLDSDVFNLFQVVSQRNKLKELKEAWLQMPIHIDLWNHWKENKETEPIKKAIRFLFLSNYGYMGTPFSMAYNKGNTAKIIYANLKKTHDFLFGVEFMNCSFQDVFKKINISEPKKTFVYCDPPYLGTKDYYEFSFTEELSSLLFKRLDNLPIGVSWAMSEFDHPFILEQSKKRGLNIINLGERNNLKNKRTEILITNYKKNQTSLF